MKTLIENSIQLPKMFYIELKTVFNITNEGERKSACFMSLTKFAGRKLTVKFNYEENGSTISDRLQMTIPKSEDENQIKDFILSEIDLHLKK
jgi:hypothetical protein